MNDAAALVFWGASTAISIAVGVLVYRDAKSRDYTPFVWGLIFPLLAVLSFGNPLQIGLLFVGIPIYLVLRPKGEIKTCPHCGRKYLDYLAFCPHCKREVKKECLKCHDLADLDATKCPHCGAPMPRHDGR